MNGGRGERERSAYPVTITTSSRRLIHIQTVVAVVIVVADVVTAAEKIREEADSKTAVAALVDQEGKR